MDDQFSRRAFACRRSWNVGIVKRGARYSIRYYDASGRQRWETIGPNRKEAETVLNQRLYEVRTGIYPVLRRRTRMTFRVFAEEWEAKHLVMVRESTKCSYRRLLKYHLLPAFGDRVLSGIARADVQDFIARAAAPGALAPKTVNNALGLLKEMLSAAVEWGFLPSSPIHRLRKLRRPRRDTVLWTPAEIRKFLLAAPEAWRTVWLVGVFAGLRPGEVQAMRWAGQNWPDFAANKIRVNCAYEATSKVLGPPKTDFAVRDVDMVPAVRQALEALPSRTASGLVFPRAGGAMFARSTMGWTWEETVVTAGVPKIRPYDLRHTFASLLIMAGKNPLYVSRQMGHHSAGFTLDTYGHLMESVPKVQVEWIDELVFPEGWETALNLHLFGAPKGANRCSPLQRSKGRKSNKIKAQRDVVQSGAAGWMAGGGGFEPPLTGPEPVVLPLDDPPACAERSHYTGPPKGRSMQRAHTLLPAATCRTHGVHRRPSVRIEPHARLLCYDGVVDGSMAGAGVKPGNRREDQMTQSPSADAERDATLPCPRCRGEMHPMFLYEDRDPDVWLCFSCGHLEWTNPGIGRPIPSVDQ